MYNSIQILPLVTIVVPSFNHKKYIEECIDSIYNNGYDNINVVVIDDSSTDGSIELLKKLQEKYGFKLVVKEKNSGLVHSINLALTEYVTTKYYKLLSSDDILIEGCIEKAINIFRSNDLVEVIAGNAYCIDENSNIIKEHKVKIKGEKNYKNFLAGNIDYNITATFYKTDMHNKIGLFQPNVISEDIYLSMKIWKYLNVEFTDCYITGYRSHPENTTKKTWLMYQEALRALDFIKDDEYYNVKKSRENLNFFSSLSKDYKIEAIKYLPGSLKYINDRLFWIGLLNLIGVGGIIKNLYNKLR